MGDNGRRSNREHECVQELTLLTQFAAFDCAFAVAIVAGTGAHVALVVLATAAVAVIAVGTRRAVVADRELA